MARALPPRSGRPLLSRRRPAVQPLEAGRRLRPLVPRPAMSATGAPAASDTCNSLWIGARLGAVERACLRSLMRHGHRLVLWCYALPDGVPDGVELRDAGEIVPESRIVAYAEGSHALFANLFRYELLRREPGLWVDCDVYALAPLTGLPD